MAFDIQALEINSLGTLMAVIGETQINIVVLPSLATIANNQAGAAIKCRNYTIDLGSGCVGVIKALWQGLVVPQDCLLVVLTSENTILMFDVNLSTTTYQIKVDLNQYGINAVSIAFGATNKNLAGMLTLYVATESEIYAIYPFFKSTMGIALTSEVANNFMVESKFISEIVDKEFPTYNALVSLKCSGFKKAVLRQLSFAKSTMNAFIKQKKFSNDPHGLEVVLYQLPDSDYDLQGPLISFPKDGRKLVDICHLQANLQFSSLAATFVTKDGSVVLNTLSQLRPLLMRWKEDREYEDEKVEQPVVAKGLLKSTEEYQKPKRGFGFVLEEEDSTKNDQVSQDILKVLNAKKQESASNLQQMKYWKKNFTRLTKVSDNLVFSKLDPKGSFSLISNPVNQNLICLTTDERSCFANIEPVIDSLASSFLLGNTLKLKPAVNPRFQLVESITTTKHIAILNDPFENEYLISLNNQQLNIAKCKITKDSINLTPKNIEQQIVEKKIDEIAIAAGLEKDPIDELIGEISQLKVGISVADNAKKRLDPADLESVKRFNHVSNEVIRQVSQLTEYLLRLDKRINMQSQILKKEAEVYNEISEKKLGGGSKTKQDTNEARLAELLARQDKSREALARINRKVADASMAVQRNKALVLSDAEKNWLKELNRIVTKLTGEKGLDHQIKDANLQAQKLIEAWKGETEKPPQKICSTDMAQNYQNTQALNRIKVELFNIGESLKNLKLKASTLLAYNQEEVC